MENTKWPPFARDIVDRAREWLNNSHPHLYGSDYDRALLQACKDIEDIDTDADVRELTGYRQ